MCRALSNWKRRRLAGPRSRVLKVYRVCLDASHWPGSRPLRSPHVAINSAPTSTQSEPNRTTTTTTTWNVQQLHHSRLHPAATCWLLLGNFQYESKQRTIFACMCVCMCVYLCACMCVCECLPSCVCELKLNMERDMCCWLLTPVQGSGACSMHNLLTNKLLIVIPWERKRDRGERAHCTSIYFVERDREREINFDRKTKNMRKLFRCLVDRLVLIFSKGTLEGNMKIKQRRERESGREHSLSIYLPRGISPTATSAWTAATKADVCLPRLVQSEKNDRRSRRCLLDVVVRAPSTLSCIYYLYIEQIAVSIMWVCMCVFSICECICVCVPHWRQHILAALSERIPILDMYARL